MTEHISTVGAGLLYLSQARLRRDVRGSTGALLDLIFQSVEAEDGRRKMDGAHKLVWSLFPDLGGERPFLFRQDGDQLLILSDRQPEDTHNLWDLQTKRFSPPLREGLRLRLSLRANAVVRRGHQRLDLVQDARKRGDQRPRDDIAADLGAQWGRRQLEKVGLEVQSVTAGNYSVHRFRKQGQRDTVVAVTDFVGAGTVRDPEALWGALRTGIGPAKSYGCGLILIGPA